MCCKFMQSYTRRECYTLQEVKFIAAKAIGMQINPIVEATSKNTRSCEAIPVLMFFPQLKALYVVVRADSCCYEGVISIEFNTT